MNILNYLLQTNLYLILFMGFYTVILRNETYFKQNRIFLNGSIILSFTIPFLNSPWFNDLFLTNKIRESAIVPANFIFETIVVEDVEKSTTWAMSDLIIMLYLIGVTFFFLRFIFRLLMLKSKLKEEKGSAFSFFNKLIVDKTLPDSDTIINHERVHIRELHSIDIILAELSSIINWFNPIIYLYKKEIMQIHEFIADEEAAKHMECKSQYAMLLFNNAMGINPNALTNNFFNNSILKRRIKMLNKTKSSKTGLWKYGLSAPLFTLMLIFSAASVAKQKTDLLAKAEELLMPLVSKEILAKDSLKNSNEITKIQSSVADEKPNSINSNENSQENDFNTLWKHLQKNLRYPSSARENNIMGYAIVSFKVQSGKISNVKITKGLQNDIDLEVLRSFDLFKESVEAKDDEYSMAIAFQLSGMESKLVPLPDFGKTVKTNLIKTMYVVGYAQEKNTDKDVIQFPPPEKKVDFGDVDNPPSFVGGMKAWGEYLQANLKYPEEARKNNVTGRVIVSFTILKSGDITDVRVLKGIGSGADEEAIRVLKESPKWTPGTIKGKPVNVAFTLPISFQLAPKPSGEKIN
ncbi:M56 family metallopeptidase [Daejeonella sp.]|uniref:M56 family metallopeptidase n=1 Tax=Daejeonella sp. TaxID=2805397 RepID=UPI0025B81D77|nr:M56 family metallopeptidase [Daejeonella sp.]